MCGCVRCARGMRWRRGRRHHYRTANSAPAEPTNTTGQVQVSGLAQVDNILSATVTDANGLTTSALSYQWQLDATAIADATMATLTLTDAQAGGAVQVQVTYTDDDGCGESLISVATNPVAIADAIGPVILAETAVDLRDFDPVTDDLDGQARDGQIDSGADHISTEPVTTGVLTRFTFTAGTTNLVTLFATRDGGNNPNDPTLFDEFRLVA